MSAEIEADGAERRTESSSSYSTPPGSRYKPRLRYSSGDRVIVCVSQRGRGSSWRHGTVADLDKHPLRLSDGFYAVPVVYSWLPIIEETIAYFDPSIFGIMFDALLSAKPEIM
ncbi:hypothetical protein BD413DRAFT_554323 [Trametes elegans]|nr:hypothetical protein BD413DRAFT_554323 [Trametes elegans]